MKKRLLRVFLGAFSLMILCACGAGGVTVKQERFQRTGISAQEAAAILLERYVSDNRRQDSEDRERELVDCLREAMRVDGPLIETVSGYDFRATLFPGVKFDNAPRTPAALLDLLKKDDVQSRVLEMGVRYLVTVDIQTSGRRSVFRASILDSKNRVESGKLYSDSIGMAAVTLPFLSRTEREACSGLGKAVYNFITSDEVPAPAKSQ